MPYTARSFTSIRDVPSEDWAAVQDAAGDRFTDPAFVEVVENSLAGQTQTGVVVVYDEHGRPVAIATQSIVRLDVTMEATPFWRRCVAGVRRLWPGFLRLRVAMWGLPTTFEQRKFAFLPTADRREAMGALDSELGRFARCHGAAVIISGDNFTVDEAWLECLTELGYMCGGSYPTHYLELAHDDLDDYLGAMRSSYRNDIRSDIRLADPNHVRWEDLTSDQLRQAPICEELHSYYLQLIGRVDFLLLTLPREFFNEFIRRSADHLRVTRVYVDGRPAGFSIGIEMNSMYRLLVIAVDEERSKRFGLYRNLYFRQIDYALRQGFRRISLGTTADEFKLRIGSTPYEQALYARATGLLKWPLRWFAKQLIPRVPAPTRKNVFRTEPATTVPGTVRRRNQTPRRSAA